MPLRRLLILTAAGLLLTPGLAAAGVSAGTPFPTNLLTTPDATRSRVCGSISPTTAPAAVQAQAQIATFFASNGTLTIDPDGSGPVFETPISGPLPETP